MSSNEELKPQRFFSKKLLFHFFNATLLIILVILQGSILNYYIIANFKNNVHPYFLFIADFVCVFIFAGALTLSYQFLVKKQTLNVKKYIFASNNLVRKFPTKRLGVMPLSYGSWLFYSLVLFAKIIMIFTSNIPKEITTKHVFGTQLLQITIALSGIIFYLLVEGHNGYDRNSPRYSYVTHVCGKTGIEILDAVNVLALLLVDESNLPLTFTLETAVLILGSIDFLLPTLALYKLSLSDVNVDNLFLPMSILYSVLHLLMIDVPFLTLRIYLWCKYQKRASLFLMKNVFGIFVALRSIGPDLKDYCETRGKLDESRSGNDEVELETMNRSRIEA